MNASWALWREDLCIGVYTQGLSIRFDSMFVQSSREVS